MRTIAALILLGSLGASAADASDLSAMGQLRLAGGDQPIEEAGTPAVKGGQGIEAQESGNVVLGSFENGADILLWFLRDLKAGLTSESIRAHVLKNPLGRRDVFQMLGGMDKAWMVLRDPVEENPFYVCSADKQVLYLPISPTVEVDTGKGSANLARAAISAENDRLMAAFGAAKDGMVVFMKYQPDAEAIQVQAGTLYYEEGALVEAQVYDADALPMALRDRRLVKAAAVLTPPKGEAHAAYGTIRKFLAEGPDRMAQVTFNKSGGVLIKLREGDQDKRYVFITGDSVKEFAVSVG